MISDKDGKGWFYGHGYTIIELLIAMQLLLWISTLVYAVFILISQSQRNLDRKNNREMSLALQACRIVRELDAISEILEADNQQLIAVKTDGDTLRLEPETMFRLPVLGRENNSTIEYVFIYYRRIGNTLSTLSVEEIAFHRNEICAVAISLPPDADKGTQTLSTMVFLRKLKRNIPESYRK